MRARVCASRVLPQPVGPISRMFDFAASLRAMREALVMIMDCDGEHPLGAVRADHIIVEDLANLGRGRDPVARLDQRGLRFLADDVVAELDALVADENGGAGNELADLVLRLTAE